MRTDEAVRRAEDVLSSRLSSYKISAMEMAQIVKDLAPEVEEARRLKAELLGLRGEVRELRDLVKPCSRCEVANARTSLAERERDAWREKHRALQHLAGALSARIFNVPPHGFMPKHTLQLSRGSEDAVEALREALRQ